VAAIGLIDVVGARTGAQSPEVAAEVGSVEVDGEPIAGANTAPSVSADGGVVVFTTAESPAGGVDADFDIVIRSRGGESPDTVFVGVGSPVPIAAAVSADGCTVAYSALVDRADAQVPPVDPGDGEPIEGDAAGLVRQVAPPADPVVELRTLDVCGAPGLDPQETVLDRVDGAEPFAAPVLSADGTFIAWSTGNEIRRYDNTSRVEAPAFVDVCLLYTSPSPRDRTRSRMPSSA